MNGKVAVILLGLLTLAVVFVGLGTMPSQQAVAQPGGGFGPGWDPPGRYTVVKVSDTVGTTNIILLDTATGDLYRATADDAKPYRERPRHGGGFPGGFRDKDDVKDGPFRDKDRPAFEKDRPFRDKRDGDKDISPFKDIPKDGRDKDARKDAFRKDGDKDAPRPDEPKDFRKDAPKSDK